MYPVLFKIFGFEVRSFGVLMVIAFLSAIWLCQQRAAKFGLNKDKVGDLSLWLLGSGVIGARVVFILQDLPYYLAHKSELLSLRFSGLTSFGGLIFGLIALVVWCRVQRVSIVSVLDMVAPCFLLGHIFGRFGCFFNGCCYGRACDASYPLATHFAEAPGLHQPAQLYDAAMNVGALAVLLAWERKGLSIGKPFCVALALHGLTRFIYEFWRAGTDSEVQSGVASSTYWGNLPITQAQGMAAVLILVGIIGFAIFSRRPAVASQPRTA